MKPNSFTPKFCTTVILFLLLVTAVFSIPSHQQASAAPHATCNVPTPTQTIQQALWDSNCTTVNIVNGTHAVNGLNIDRSVIVTGSSPGNVILDGGGLATVMSVFNNPSNVTITNLTLRNGGGSNGGGGISIDNGTVVIENVRIINNNVTGVAGGIINYAGDVTITNSEISGNHATNYGGGIHNNPGATMSLENVTISGNKADNSSGGISNGGTLSLLNVTVANNTAVNGFAPGVGNEGTVTFKNSIVANGIGADCGGAGTFTSSGHNLEDDDSCSFNSTGDKQFTDPQLAPLAANGAETYTQALLSNSPARNAGTNSGCPATDQRGITRPQQAVCDMGAFELDKLYVYLPVVIRP